MSVFEFTTVLLGFVVALGVTRVLGGVADLVLGWSRLRDPILFSLWFALLLLLPIGWWTSLWRMADASTVNLVELLLLFHVPAFIYIATHLVVPLESEFLKLDERYDTVRTPFTLCLGVPFFVGPGLGLLSGNIEMIYLWVMSVLLLSLPFSKTRKYDYFVSAICLFLYIGFIVQYRSVISSV
jgi:hypothetical protein